MNDHIIKAAKEAGIEFQDNRSITGRITTATYGSQPIKKMERFYAIAYRAGLEDAAKFCTDEGLYCTAHDIRALMKETP